eukprot:CAMPEP_0196780098 /NCGR_PEP_ID=MMETSP1104-20130614/7114_1 /TAXON_ID=33652 /ORGANISM="Cafeteria sp., Strain Caron Lab Isolate" /LENGTH=86 /DNA_ID=CAMNT_0042150289 /DNA_START=9 /DNA_END=269 /DNA_ORIENTATION=+
MSFFGRVIAQQVQGLLTKALAESRVFQRFAQNSVRSVEKAKRVVRDGEPVEFSTPVFRRSKPVNVKPKEPDSFLGHLFNEIKKDMK